MKIVFMCMMALSFAKIGYSDDLISEPTMAPSNYADAALCQKLKINYSFKYDDKYFQNLLSKGISTEAIVTELRSPEGRSLVVYQQENILKLARCERRIDDVVFSLVHTRILQNDDQTSDSPRHLPAPTMELSTYLKKKDGVTKISSKKNSSINTNPFPLSKFPTTVGENKKITVLERLYALYTPSQIKKMSQIMDLTLNVMDANQVETKIIFREETKRENYVVEHTPSDIYRLALRIFNMEKKKLEQDYRSQGLPFSNLDVLAAAYEMGIVSDSDIGILTSDESFYKKDKSFLKKMGTYLTKLGLTAAQVNPVTAPYALVGIILFNSYQELNQNKERIEYENFYFN